MLKPNSMPTGMFDSFDSIRFDEHIVRQQETGLVGLSYGEDPFSGRLPENCETTRGQLLLALLDDEAWDRFAPGTNPPIHDELKFRP